LLSPTFREQRINWRTFIHTYLPLTVTFAITSHNLCAGYEPWRDTTTWIAWFPAILTGNMITWSMLASPDFLASVRLSLPKCLPWRQCHWPFDLDAIQMTTARTFNTVAICY
jgi:hypothetical protein